MSLPRGAGGGPAARAAPTLLDAESRPVDRSDLIARARAGFELAGRGVVVYLSGEPGARYASRNEIKERLAEAQVEPELLAGVLYAVDRYDPKWQAVLFLEQEECCTVSIVGYERSEVVESVSWTAVN